MRRLSSLILSLLLLLAGATHAQNGRTVTLITVGPGDAVWEQFGHNIICISSDKTGFALCYDWGRFDFEEPGFLWRFIQGKMVYSMDGARAQMASGVPNNAMLDAYDAQQRHITYQRLPLSEDQIDDLLFRCETNRQPQNQRYRYDYFTDNCSTRVRDMLDAVTQGQIRKSLDIKPTSTSMTYRQHANRLMQSDLLLSLGMDFVLGPACDRALSPWEESFLPTRFSAAITPWAMDTRSTASPRPSEPAAPPDRRAGLAMAGSLLAAAIASLALSTGKWTRRLAQSLLIGWWIVCSVGAFFMLYLWCFTDHTAGYANQNLLHYSPLAILLLALPIYRRIRKLDAAGIRKPMLGVAIAVLAISVAGLLLNLTGVLSQANLGFILLALPLHIAAIFVVARLTVARAPDQLAAT